MDEIVEQCGQPAPIILCWFSLGISSVLISTFFTNLCSMFISWLRNKRSKMSGIQKDILEIIRATSETSNEHKEIKKLITEIKGHEARLIEDLRSEFQVKCEALGQTIKDSLREEVWKNSNRYEVIMKEIIESVLENILFTKNSLETLIQKTEEMSTDISTKFKGDVTLMNSSTQTVSEMKRKFRDGHARNSINSECEAAKLINLVKKCLTEVVKDVKIYLANEREDDSRDLRIIFAKLAADREDIKRTIVQAFAIASDQAKRNFDQVGLTGKEAMRYVAALNENTYNLLKTKLEYTDDKLREISDAVKQENFDVTLMKETLQNIDGQFDEIFRKVELGHQRNTEQCEEMAEKLEKASNNWLGRASELERISKEFFDDTQKIKDVLNELNSLIDLVHRKNLDISMQANNEIENKIAQYELIKTTTDQELSILLQKQKQIVLTNPMIQSWWDKMTCMNSTLENRCEEVGNLARTLKRKLLSLHESVEKVDEVLRNADIETAVNQFSKTKPEDRSAEEFFGTLVRRFGACTGEGHRNHEPKQFSRKLRNEALTLTVQNGSTIDKELDVIERHQRRINTDRNLYEEKIETFLHFHNAAKNEQISDGVTNIEQCNSE